MPHTGGTLQSYLNLELPYIHNLNQKLEVRKVQAYRDQKRSILVELLRIFTEKLKIKGGDYLKMYVDDDRLVLQKAGL